jgi:uncharacterized tellurite resistance protein B-like protein
MSKTRLKKEFQRLPKEKLVDLISDLYNKNKSVKEFSDFYHNPKNERSWLKSSKSLSVMSLMWNILNAAGEILPNALFQISAILQPSTEKLL